jgi:hypothetical protein
MSGLSTCECILQTHVACHSTVRCNLCLLEADCRTVVENSVDGTGVSLQCVMCSLQTGSRKTLKSDCYLLVVRLSVCNNWAPNGRILMKFYV